MINRALFKSMSVEWATPKALLEALTAEFAFNYDPCPLGGFGDGLSESWKGKIVYCNPPYGPGIEKWLAAGKEAAVAVYLLPARTDTRWFHEKVLTEATEIRFIRGRLKFGDAKHNAPFPSVIVIFDRRNEK